MISIFRRPDENKRFSLSSCTPPPTDHFYHLNSAVRYCFMVIAFWLSITYSIHHLVFIYYVISHPSSPFVISYMVWYHMTSYDIILYYMILYYIMLYHIVSYYLTLCYDFIWYYIILYFIILHYIIFIILYYIYYIILYLLYYIILY